MAARSTVARHTDITIIPITLAEADADMSRLHAIEQTIAEIEAKLAADIARLRERARAKAAPLKEARINIRKRLEAWAKLNYRKIVTRHGKSIRLTHGTIKYRYDPPSVVVKKVGDKRMIAKLKKRGLNRYVRVEETINREQILKDRIHIPGITRRQRNRCHVRPDPVMVKKPRSRAPSVKVRPAKQ